jgi:hypothetical protein
VLKLVVLLVIIVVGVLLVRNALQRGASRRADAEAKPADEANPEAEATLVRCVACGAFVPKAGAVVATNGYRCGGSGCKPGAR